MDKFEELKQAAESKLKADEAAFSAWVTKYRWAFYIACAVIGFILGKAL